MMSILVTYTFPTFFAQFPAAPKIDDDVTMQVVAILNFFSCHLFYDIIRYNCTKFQVICSKQSGVRGTGCLSPPPWVTARPSEPGAGRVKKQKIWA